MNAGLLGVHEEKCVICDARFVPDRPEERVKVCHVCLEDMRRYCPKCDALGAMDIYPPECLEHVHYTIKFDRVFFKDPYFHHPLKRQFIFKKGNSTDGRSITIGPASKATLENALDWLNERYKSVADLYPDFNPEQFLTSCEVCGSMDIDHLHLVHEEDETEALMVVCKPCLRDAMTGVSTS